MNTATELLDNTSHMDWLTPSQKMLVEAMMEAYKDLAFEKVDDIVKETLIEFTEWGGFDTGEPAEDIVTEFMGENY